MAKKYLSIEEAAERLGLSTDKLTRCREKGDIRGFADRGTWKFKADDVEEYARRQQADSDPAVPLFDADDAASGDAAQDTIVDSAFVLDDENALAEQPTIVRESLSDDLPLTDGTSDSDVRLVFDDSLVGDTDTDPEVPLVAAPESDSDTSLPDDFALATDSDSDVQLIASDSDSDVSLVEEPPALGDSDSDVKIAGSSSDSDVRLVADDAAESDSDVKLLDTGSDSDVKLIAPDQHDSDSDVALVSTTDSDISPMLNLDEDITEQPSAPTLADSDVSLGAGSGISLEGPADSGISLEGDDSITLEIDSGITLAEEEEGITLAETDDSGIALQTDVSAGGGDDSVQTIPLLRSDGDADDDLDETMLEVPLLDSDDDNSSEFELGALEDDGDADTSVLLFDDDEEPDELAETMVKKSGEMDLDGDDFDLDASEAEFDDDDFDVADDVVGEDDELDVFDADDEDFEESFETGESHAEFVAPARGRAAAVPIEADWGAATFVGLTISALMMCVCGLVMYDLVRTMWGWQEISSFNGPVLDLIAGLFK